MSRIEGYKAGSGGSPEEGVTTCDGAGLGEEGTAPRFPPGPRSQSHLLLAHGTWGLDLYPGVGGLLDATQSLSGGRREGKARPNASFPPLRRCRRGPWGVSLGAALGRPLAFVARQRTPSNAGVQRPLAVGGRSFSHDLAWN